MGKKKKRIIRAAVLAVFILCAATACGRQQAEPNIPLQDLVTEYPIDNILSFAVTEDGTVYGANLDVTGEEPENTLNRLNAQGEYEEYIRLKNYFMVGTFALSEDEEYIYFTAENDIYGFDPCLFACRVADGSIEMLCTLPYFSRVKQIAVVGDTVYLLGRSPGWQAKTPPASGYSFLGERLVSYTPDTGEQMQLGFDFPINMAASRTGTLIVSGYLEGTGYCLMEYDPAKDSMQVVGQMGEYIFDYFAVCNNGKDVIYEYRNGLRGIVLSEIGNLSAVAELLPTGEALLYGVVCAGGKVYCKERFSGKLISFPLDAVQRQNKELAFITQKNSSLSPYGCGYQMERVELSDEKFALKVLARDKDYDLCMGDTLADNGSNLKENGVFYPLNDVPGIEEYLERCFPYVREAATKEDGTIWMLPVQVDIFTLVARQTALEESGLTLQENMTWVEYADLVRSATKEQQGRIALTQNFTKLLFCGQYFSQYHTVEDSSFVETAVALSEIWRADCGHEINLDNFLLQWYRGVWWIASVGRLIPPWQEDAVFVAMPKLAAEDKNIASCIYLAVNPDSARRKETLAYLADLIAYMMRDGDIPYFTDWQTQDAFDEAMHALYANGEIGFAADPDVYDAGLEELFEGTLTVEEYIRQTEPKLKMYWGE